MLALVALSIAVSYGQMALDLGLSPREFAAEGDSTLRAAPFAFSIWGVIYLWLIAYGVYQALPRTPEDGLVVRLGWPSVLALLGITLWVMAAAADLKWIGVALIVASGLSLVVPLLGLGAAHRLASARQRTLVAWPLGLLAGWLTIASVLNLITTATAYNMLPPALTPDGWALTGIALVTGVAVAVTARTRLWTYPLPVAWGLLGVFSAERSDGQSGLAFAAIGAGALIIAVSAVLLMRRPARVPEPDTRSPVEE